MTLPEQLELLSTSETNLVYAFMSLLMYTYLQTRKTLTQIRTKYEQKCNHTHTHTHTHILPHS